MTRPAEPMDRSLDDLALSVGATLRRLRETAGATTADLARNVGVDTREIEDWESGRTLPPMMGLLAAVDTFGTDLGPFFGWTETGGGEAVASAGEITPAMSEVVEVTPGAPSEAMTCSGPALVIALHGELLVTGSDRVPHRLRRGEAVRVPDAAALRIHAGGKQAATATIVPLTNPTPLPVSV